MKTFPRATAWLISILYIFTSSANAEEFVNSYTPEQFRDMAINYKMIYENKKVETMESAMQAMEFKGYVAGYLDAHPSIPDLNACLGRNTVSVIAARSAHLLSIAPLDRRVPTTIPFLTSLAFACDEKAWKQK